MNYFIASFRPLVMITLICFISCSDENNRPSDKIISELNLKRGEIISCGNSEQQFGEVSFRVTGNEEINREFNLGLSLLHSFEYDEAEKVFARIIDKYPDCSMAYWGVAMSNFHPLWAAPTIEELRKGERAVAIARSVANQSEKEEAFIRAIAAYYKDADRKDHRRRCDSFREEMVNLYETYPEEKEAAIFYALSLMASADPADQTFQRQRMAGDILKSLYPAQPNHPGIVHYIIHTYDYPGLAEMALSSAREYAKVAPSSAHALHMPSHIFTRLGLWDDCIESNLASVNAAKCYGEQAGLDGNWDEELHGLDYLVYAYLQKGDNKRAQEQLIYLGNIKKVIPANFKVAYSFAAIPARFYLENRNWKEAATLSLYSANIQWDEFPWQQSINHFARLLGLVQLGRTMEATTELKMISNWRDTLLGQKDSYKARQVEILEKAGDAWIQFGKGQRAAAITLMIQAANMEDSTEKHPVTPGEILPAREQLGDMYLQIGDHASALNAYETALVRSPNRFNGLAGAGRAAAVNGDKEKAEKYYSKLLEIADKNADRKEIGMAKAWLGKR